MPLQLTNPGRPVINSVHWLWLAVFVLCTLLQLAELVPALRYDRYLVSDNQWWRLFTAQLVHVDWPHWLLNMMGVGIVAFFFSRYDGLWHWLLVTGLCALTVGMGIHLYNPEVARFVGLSGVLHGLFIYGAIREVSRFPMSGYALLAILVAKLGYEWVYGVMPYTQEMSSGNVITDSHLYGAIGGALIWMILTLSQRCNIFENNG